MMMKSAVREKLGSMVPGQDLVVTGYIGWKGTRVIAGEMQQDLLKWFTSDYLESILQRKWNQLDPDTVKDLGVTEYEMIEEGGIMAALWNLSGVYEIGIEFQLRQIPIRQETIELCERYDLNPYRLLSEDCCLLVADNGGQLVEALRKRAIYAVVIGKVNSGIKREIYQGDSRGFLDRPKKDELKKVVPTYFIK